MLCGVDATRSPDNERAVSCGCAMIPMGTPDRLLLLNAVVVLTGISSSRRIAKFFKLHASLISKTPAGYQMLRIHPIVAPT
jgi:hypothetical protein